MLHPPPAQTKILDKSYIGKKLKAIAIFTDIIEDMDENKTVEPKVWQPGNERAKLIANSEEHLLTSEEEFQKAFDIIKKHPRRVTFFGSARTHTDDKYFQLAYELANKLAAQDFAILTGGGAGIMGAANKGAYDAQGSSLGFNITLPHEQNINNFTTDHLTFDYFFTRKVMLTFYAHAYVFFPGGFGTLDEFFEVLTLIQTGKMPRAPLICVGDEFWSDLNSFIHKNQLAHGAITPGDEKIYTITEDQDQIISLVSAAAS